MSLKRSTRLAFWFSLCAFACSGAADHGDPPGDDPDAASGAADSGSTDAPPEAECSGLDEEACDAAAGCVPGCFSTICDCACPVISGNLEQCGCEGCPRDCFEYQECLPAVTPCGPDGLECDPETEICVELRAHLSDFECRPVPPGCEDDRSCGCVADGVCEDIFSLCFDSAEANTVACECPAC